MSLEIVCQGRFAWIVDGSLSVDFPGQIADGLSLSLARVYGVLFYASGFLFFCLSWKKWDPCGFFSWILRDLDLKLKSLTL